MTQILAPNGRNGASRGLPPLVVPAHLAGKMTNATPKSLVAERAKWAAARGAEGYSSGEVGRALGIAQRNAYCAMRQGGWDTWASKRKQR